MRTTPELHSTPNDHITPRENKAAQPFCSELGSSSIFFRVAAVAEWSRYQIVAGLDTSSRPVPLKTRLVGERCTLNLSRAHKRPPIGVVR
ncbi:hypothetical protein TNCV_479281 [Trichonephila clavipes]|nr:hypothetical protein TNCV_479281 [Trichonephila clavipes]